MRKLTYILLLFFFISQLAIGQTYKLNSGNLEIIAIAPLDTITAVTKKMEATLDRKTNSVSFECSVKSFVFEDQLILTNLSKTILNVKEHPRIRFEGKYHESNKEGELKEENTPIQIDGILTLNGVAQKLSVEAVMIIDREQISINFGLVVILSDHNVVIPSILRDALSNKIMVVFDIDMKPTSIEKPSKK